jgi:thiamine kinase-like enzyme
MSLLFTTFSQPPVGNGLYQPVDIDPMRLELPDDPINFTHGDLHRSNILVTPAADGPSRVMAIVDWHQCGWYPAYWEYCNARRTIE